jgi:hypothetical protein
MLPDFSGKKKARREMRRAFSEQAQAVVPASSAQKPRKHEVLVTCIVRANYGEG